MGVSKSLWQEENDRGWRSVEKSVCETCVKTQYLSNVVRDNASRSTCSYCKRVSESSRSIAIPFDELMAYVMRVVHLYYETPWKASVPIIEGDYLVRQEFDTGDVFHNLGLDLHHEVYDDVLNSIDDHRWISCANGSWLSPHLSEFWAGAWRAFCDYIKHTSRFGFMLSQKDEADYFGDLHIRDIPALMVKTAEALGLFREVKAKTPLFRVRLAGDEEAFESFAYIGPPPSAVASAGRMNPAGIAYLYSAFDRSTALAETIKALPTRAGIARLVLLEDVLVLDLSKLPDAPDLWDASQYELRQKVLFFQQLIADLSAPVTRDGREHVDYVPSQVVTEYVRHIASYKGCPVQGIVYPSALNPGGENVVLFPVPDPAEQFTDLQRWERLVGLVNIEMRSVEHWQAMMSLLAIAR